jgi:serine/threonine protein kinase
MELLHQSGEIINERYRILDTLGQGGVGITYEALDLQSSERVALKALSLRRMTDWKMMELFEREARILSQLNHPAIPDYLDYFQVDTKGDRSFYIAQQLAPGKSLTTLVENGWQPDEEEVRYLAIQILEILVYLHELIPPVIHRDIKPQNLIRQDNGVFLVDFGAVQDTYHNTVTGGSTVVGTFGYMAPEQFRGQAVLSTDLYGLGTTLIFLLTQKSPADLPQRQLKINFRPYVRVSKDFADWLEKMLEPAMEDRFPSPKEALAVLRGEQPLTRYLAQKPYRPKNSPIILTKTEEQLVVEIPPGQLRNHYSLVFALLVVVGNIILLLMLWAILESSIFDNLLFSFFSFVFSSNFLPSVFLLVFLLIYAPLGLRMLDAFLLSSLSRTRLTVNQQNFRLQRCLLGWCFQEVKGRTSDIRGVTLNGVGIKPIVFCVLRRKLRKYRFGSFLTQSEKDWLVGEIATFLTAAQPTPPSSSRVRQDRIVPH